MMGRYGGRKQRATTERVLRARACVKQTLPAQAKNTRFLPFQLLYPGGGKGRKTYVPGGMARARAVCRAWRERVRNLVLKHWPPLLEILEKCEVFSLFHEKCLISHS
ncbi:MAG: hypothetical protein Q4F30_10665 [Akkermansia sp.]|nr:hypothetical protein [Akkermansia sp.]